MDDETGVAERAGISEIVTMRVPLFWTMLIAIGSHREVVLRSSD